jgi:hypothetical protein
MAYTFHRTQRDEHSPVAVEVGQTGVAAFRTADGEVISFDGVSADEVAAKADEFLAWAG